MSISVVYSRAQLGTQAPTVSVEVHLTGGLPRFAIVGLPETVVRESKDRVRSALLSNQFSFPRGRVTVNLAPADLPKEGGRFDLAIAIGILIASRQLIPGPHLAQYELAGELSLTGEIKPFSGGILPFVLQSKKENKIAIIPLKNTHQIGLITLGEVYVASHLMEVFLHLQGSTLLPPLSLNQPPQKPPSSGDLAEVKGQFIAKRALEIAAAGGHNLLLIGPPGSGKTLLASRLPSILPELSEREATEVATLMEMRAYPIDQTTFFTPPFRAPHHSASSTSLVGGGSKALPGEASLSHRGVLFLDELPEFQRTVLDMLREPLESGTITVSHAHRTITYPAEFQLIAAMNPCPCGYYGSKIRPCECMPPQIQRYRHKLSGPLLDRFDLSIFVHDLPPSELLQKKRTEESSIIVKARVLAARSLQQNRQGMLNQKLNHGSREQYAPLQKNTEQFLSATMEKRKCSARSLTRVIRVARTVADLAGETEIKDDHIAEVLQMRYFDSV